MAKTKAGASVAAGNSPNASGGGSGFMSAGSNSRPAHGKSSGALLKHSAYPSPAKGGGKAGTGNGPPRNSAGKPDSHPRSRKPMVR